MAVHSHAWMTNACTWRAWQAHANAHVVRWPNHPCSIDRATSMEGPTCSTTSQYSAISVELLAGNEL